MIKFTVHTETFEFNPTKFSNAEEAYWAYEDHNDNTIGMFDTLDKARTELAKIKVITYRFSYKVAQATAAWIEESEYEEDDGELCFLGGANVWDFKFEETPEI